MKLTFDRALVEQLLDHAEKATTHAKTFTQQLDQATTEPGAALWIVADDGIYACSNGRPFLPGKAPGTMLVWHAAECNPNTMPFERWWKVKNAAFGGDDSVESFDAADVPHRAEDLQAQRTAGDRCHQASDWPDGLSHRHHAKAASAQEAGQTPTQTLSPLAVVGWRRLQE
jgi:hypothetical protein